MDVHRIISLFLIYFTFCPCISYGQQYPIPGATQQATWVFPIFFEEASGKKDTIYLGYDGTYANNFGCFDDGYFNEQNVYHFAFDTNYIVFPCLESYIGGHDSISKVNILSDLSILFTVFVNNAKYPLKIKWDSTLLWSDSIPFPSVNGFPKAEVLLDWYFGTNLPNVVSCYFSNILITDSCNYYCCAADSMVFFDTDNSPEPINSYFTIRFRPWSGLIIGEDEIIYNTILQVIPNIVLENTEVRIKSSIEISAVKIFNLQGILQFEKEIFENKIPIQNLVSGSYFIECFKRNEFIGFAKIIIL
ncbi:MAG: T9SS type A sorting domain-containing protein [Bacteroidetes bacterium]|nr:T9SS type A sorting domain-containing protein [Bacteroidota bacterium]